MATKEPAPTFATSLPHWQVLLVFVGLPILYLANSFLPWSVGLWFRRNHAFYLSFWASIALLHWGSVALIVVLLKRAGGRLDDIGLDLSAVRVAAMVGIPLVAGLALILLHESPAANDGPLSERSGMSPNTLGERVFWIFMSFTAGFCEELVYRGFSIRLLKGRGMRTWRAVGLATLAFVFVHGIAGLVLFPVYFVVGLLFAGLFLWQGSLVPGICLHALFDIVAVMGYS